MFGCHKCPDNGKAFDSYEKSPCSSCSCAKDPSFISRFEADPGSFSGFQVMHPSYDDDQPEALSRAFSALGQCVKALVSMKERHPDTYKFVIAKMDNPSISYSELASMFNCRKQNVQYHFKKAVSIIPELSHALIVDSRFLGGKRSPLKPKQGAAHSPAA